MVAQVSQRVHIIPVSLDHDQLGRIFEEQIPDRVHLLYNDNPINSHEKTNKKAINQVESLVKNKTMCYENDEVINHPINFYRFEEALVDSYKLIYEEEKKGNEVYVNISGGTKPVAIALSFACALNETGYPIYYLAESYEESEGGPVVSHGVADSIEISPIQLLDMTDIMPSGLEKHEIMISLLNKNKPVGITDLLISMDKIAPKPPGDENKRSERTQTIQRYHRYANQLKENGILKKYQSDFGLTSTGRLISRLVEAKQEIDREMEEQTSVTDYT